MLRQCYGTSRPLQPLQTDARGAAAVREAAGGRESVRDCCHFLEIFFLWDFSTR
eukprot:SAG31_NODE_1379_length_8582_cov_17.482848_6_plen_54_part_00